MADLLALSSRIIDSGVADEPVNRITNQLSEVADGLAIVESFSHSVILDAGDGLVAFDASHARTGADVVAAIRGWTSTPVSHLVYTHGHADHVGGSCDFAAAFDEMTVVGHRQVDERFDRYAYTNDWNVRINARQFGGVRGDFGMGETGDFIPPATLRPNHVVDDHDTLVVGDRTIELHHARGETDDHLWGWMPRATMVVHRRLRHLELPERRQSAEGAALPDRVGSGTARDGRPGPGAPPAGARAADRGTGPDQPGAHRDRGGTRVSRRRGRWHDERRRGARHDRPQRPRSR